MDNYLTKAQLEYFKSLAISNPVNIVWDKGTAFESGNEVKKVERADDIIWDRGTAFESREPRFK